jgi:cell division protein FtsL
VDQLESFAQAYSQAPWRKQLQIIGLFSLILVLAALIAGVYLNVSARAAKIGREIQSMQTDINALNQETEDLQSRLAFLLSSTEMQKRAETLGFQPVTTDQVLYVNVPGYTGRQTAVLAPYTSRELVSAAGIPAEYTESLFDWLARQAVQLAPSSDSQTAMPTTSSMGGQP